MRPIKSITVRLISCPHTAFSPLGTRLEIKATAPGSGDWRCRTGLGGGVLPPLAEFRAGGGNLPGLSCPEPSAFHTDKSQTKHTRPQGMRAGLPYPSKPADVFRRFHWGFLEKLEDVASSLTNKKPAEETLIPHFSPGFSQRLDFCTGQEQCIFSSWWGFSFFENCLK